MATPKLTKQWSPQAIDPPKLSAQDWNMTMALGVVFVAMAVLQIASFNDFKDVLNATFGLSGSTSWAVVLILAELWAAVAFFKLRLSALFRMFSSVFAILVSGFWFFENVRLVASDTTIQAANSGFFGRFLAQQPGWWTVIEVTIVLFWTLGAVEMTRVKSGK